MDDKTLTNIALKVSQYFRDFLESDFKKQQAPRRRVVLQSESGFRSGMRLSPYPNLNRDIWSLISRPSGDQQPLTIVPRKYTRPISSTLQKIIREQISAIPDISVEAVRQSVIEKAQASLHSAINNSESWVDAIREELAKEVGTQLIRPLIAHLDGSLSSQAYSVMDSLYAAESDLIARTAYDLDKVLPENLAKYLATSDITQLNDAINNYLTIENVRETISQFFDTFIAADAYLEFRDLETFIATSEGLQLYLYIGSVKYRNTQYPLFFLPVEVEKSKDNHGYEIKLINHLFCNRKAIDFVLQELAVGAQREWVSPIKERITYLTPEQSIYEIARNLFRLVSNSLDLGGKIELSIDSSDASTSNVTMSPALYLSAFEKSDEALLNDFEEIIDQANRGGSAIVELFEGMVRGILIENPKSIRSEIEDEWDKLPIVDRLVFDSPIPLNEEQRKILLAIRSENGKIIVVEGPPGTGKSHTITAIAADCAFNKKSCLVLSDKTEALDVVQDKLSEAMSRVRHEKDFPNPILRLGQQNANFKKLTANQAMTQIAAYERAMRANKTKLESEKIELENRLKSDISTTVSLLGSVSLQDLKEMHHIEAELSSLNQNVLSLIQDVSSPEWIPSLERINSNLGLINGYLADIFKEKDFTPESFLTRVKRDLVIHRFLKSESNNEFSIFDVLGIQDIHEISQMIISYEQLRMPIFGYFFRKKEVNELELKLNRHATSRPLFLAKDIGNLKQLVQKANILKRSLEAEGIKEEFESSFKCISHNEQSRIEAEFVYDAVTVLNKINTAIIPALLESHVDDPKLWPLAIRFLLSWLRNRAAFDNTPAFDYVGSKSKLEHLNTSVMNAHVDGRLVKFMDNHKSDAKALASVISNRQKFPEEKFESVRESFPVIIASIREFGEYMPLIPNLFDVVVIDEASQVSVAQALPALLRAKKIVVLGDTKQFSNVKSANASIALNDKYRADLVQYFERNASNDAASLQRLAMFDVKRSILEFCSLSASYSVMLRKHFRSYQELIGYSSSTFYGHQLQAIKIRGVPIEDVIRFDQVEVCDKKVTRGTNQAEADFILEKLLEYLEDESSPSIGIITPFREQQTLLSKQLFGHAKGRDFEDKFRLKIMTFDSCQGEERNIIFYSMVATPGQDALNYIFPVSLDNAQESVEEKLKVQRLNVGFSRAQEMIWIVHSMPLSQFRGSISQALNHYANVLERDDVGFSGQDLESPMEIKVYEWLKQTQFYQSNIDNIELVPQFPVGDYLKQLDPTYQHPSWRVDFLLTYQSSIGPLYIVIEYDGFEFHFQKNKEINVGNHERYLVESDVERQLVLESYGYRFLRINRFNLGNDPVSTISSRLYKLVDFAGGDANSKAVQFVQEQAAGLASKDLKPCTRCGEIRNHSDFFDASLKNGQGGIGRVCKSCKDLAKSGLGPKKPRIKSRRRWR